MLSINENGKTYILGLDPGTKNFAYSIIEVEYYTDGKGNSTLKIQPIETGLVDSTVTSMAGARSQIPNFLIDMKFLINRKDFTIQAISVEQFQARGSQTKLLELVNIMMGALLTRFDFMDIMFFSAAAWKRAVKAKFDLDGEYKTITCTAHELDATYIGIYGAFKLLKLKPYHGYRAGYFSRIAREVERVSKTPKRKRRPK